MRRQAEIAEPRAGMLVCICDPQLEPPANDNGPRAIPTFGLALGFAFAVLAQTVASAALPLAGAQLAPQPAFATWPFAAMLLGAALASFPASFLRDAFGRRTGFALGASLGIAGGAMLVMALLQRNFAWACLGALWLGMAQGFSFFYRHEAAAASGRPAAATAGVLAGGVLAALAGPTLAGLAEDLVAPFFLVGAAGLAALAHALSLGVAVTLAPDPPPVFRPKTSAPLKAIVAPTLLGALTWFGMNAVMSGAPLALVGCGIGEAAVFGFIALHVAAMYAPAVPLALVGDRVPPAMLTVLGLALVAAAVPLQWQDTPATITAALIAVGAGWSVATVGATAWIYRAGRPSRLALALHDGVLFTCAILGAASGGVLF
ncbi:MULTISPECIES: MFS transporter [unclassified Xanthobacter]|uniref:MFS transporter n=1 Tax=unclassified Xanthobacter TaxID=2623496 RepID=UPI001EDD1023|nr:MULTISPECIES: MFS transporter [unclassified Xanthobacter]